MVSSLRSVAEISISPLEDDLIIQQKFNEKIDLLVAKYREDQDKNLIVYANEYVRETSNEHVKSFLRKKQFFESFAKPTNTAELRKTLDKKKLNPRAEIFHTIKENYEMQTSAISATDTSYSSKVTPLISKTATKESEIPIKISKPTVNTKNEIIEQVDQEKPLVFTAGAPSAKQVKFDHESANSRIERLQNQKKAELSSLPRLVSQSHMLKDPQTNKENLPVEDLNKTQEEIVFESANCPPFSQRFSQIREMFENRFNPETFSPLTESLPANDHPINPVPKQTKDLQMKKTPIAFAPKPASNESQTIPPCPPPPPALQPTEPSKTNLPPNAGCAPPPPPPLPPHLQQNLQSQKVSESKELDPPKVQEIQKSSSTEIDPEAQAMAEALAKEDAEQVKEDDSSLKKEELDNDDNLPSEEENSSSDNQMDIVEEEDIHEEQKNDENVKQNSSDEAITVADPVSQQMCSTFADEKVVNLPMQNFEARDPILSQQCRKLDNYMQAINEEAKIFNSYLNNYDVVKSREIFIQDLKNRLNVQQNFLNQLKKLEENLKPSKNPIMCREQAVYFLFLKYKAEVNAQSLQNHLKYIENEQNPAVGLLKGNGSLTVSNVRLALSSKSPNHALTAYFEYAGFVTFLMPLVINNSSSFAEFMQKVNFSDLPSDFKIRFVIAELPLISHKVPKYSKKANFVKKVKNKIIKKYRQVKNTRPMLDHFKEVGEIIISKDCADKTNFNFKGPHTALLSGKAHLQLQLTYNLDLEYSGHMSILRSDEHNNRIWVQNLVSLRNGQLFFWSINSTSQKELQIIENLHLSQVTDFRPDGEEMSGRKGTIYLEITRNWSATDVSGPLQKIAGNMIVKHVHLAVEDSAERAEWIRVLKIIIQSHQEWKTSNF